MIKIFQKIQKTSFWVILGPFWPKLGQQKLRKIWLPSAFSSHEIIHPCKKSVKNSELTGPIL